MSCQNGWLCCVEGCMTVCWHWGTGTPELWLWGITELHALYFQFLFLFFWISTCLAWCVWPSGVLVQSLCSDTGVTTMCMIWRVVLMLNVQFVWLFLFYVKRNFAVSLSVTTDSPTKVIAKHQGCIAWPIMQFKWVYWKKTVGANAFLKATLNVLSIWLFLCFLWWGDNPYLWWKRL